MRTTIDRAGRLVIPKALREELGLVAGEVEISVDGAALRVQATTTHGVEERAGRLIIPAAGVDLDGEIVRTLRDAGRR